MSSQTRKSRGDGNGLDFRTLAIASFAAAAAAVIVSRIWTAGTPIAAAATPVIVTLLKEVLDRPTAAIADRVTGESNALRPTGVWDTPAERGRQLDAPPTRATEVTPPTEHRPGDVRVYRQHSAGGWRTRVKPKVVLVTAVVAFVIAGVVITGGQILAGNPFGKDGTGTIFLGEHKVGSKKDTKTETTPTETQTVTQPAETETAPAQTTTQSDRQDQGQQQRTATEQQQRNLQRQQTQTTTTPGQTTTTP